MSISIYTMPALPDDEREREQAVLRSGALKVRDPSALEAITAEARRQLGTSRAIVVIIYQDEAYLIATSGMDAGVYRRSTSFCGHAILAPDRPFVVPDAQADARFAGNPFVDADDGIRFYAAVALTDGAGMPIGTLCVLDSLPRDGLTPAQADTLTRLSHAVMQQFG
jgi:GAF domain-containing protein